MESISNSYVISVHTVTQHNIRIFEIGPTREENLSKTKHSLDFSEGSYSYHQVVSVKS